MLGDDDQGRQAFVEAAASRLSLSGSLGDRFLMSRNDAEFYMHAVQSPVEQVELRPHTPVFSFFTLNLLPELPPYRGGGV